MPSSRTISTLCAFSLAAPACGGDPPAGGADATGSATDATDDTGSATDAAPTTSGTTASTPTEGVTTGDATDGAEATAGPQTGTSEASDTSTSTASEATTSETGEPGDTSTSGGPVECLPRAEVTAEPLADPGPEYRPVLFVRPDGYHLLHGFGSPDFKTGMVKLDPEGAVVGAPVLVASETWHQVAGSGERYAGVTRQSGNQKSLGRIHVLAIEPDDTLTPVGIAVIPSEGRGPGTIAVQWNPIAGEWGVVWEEQHDIDPNKPGFVHSRLYFGRTTADGAWVDGSKQILTTIDPTYSAQISNWANPLIWAGDRYAAVWAEYGPVTTDVYLVELTADGEPTRVAIDQGRFSRGVPAWDGVGYGVAWGHYDFDDHFTLRFVHVEDGAVGEVLHLGDDQVYSGDPSIVAVDGRFTVSWHDTAEGGASSHAFYAKIDPKTLAVETVQVSEPDFADHDWSYSLVHNGCRHAFAYQHILNPGDVRVTLFD